jgi:hypothetical protein
MRHAPRRREGDERPRNSPMIRTGAPWWRRSCLFDHRRSFREGRYLPDAAGDPRRRPDLAPCRHQAAAGAKPHLGQRRLKRRPQGIVAALALLSIAVVSKLEDPPRNLFNF